MPIIIPKTLPAYEVLREENVFVMHKHRAETQHIRPLRILILGGTGFTGPSQVQYALARGHKLTLLNRGRRPKEWPGEVEELVGDRNAPNGLDALKGRDQFGEAKVRAIPLGIGGGVHHHDEGSSRIDLGMDKFGKIAEMEKSVVELDDQDIGTGFFDLLRNGVETVVVFGAFPATDDV